MTDEYTYALPDGTVHQADAPKDMTLRDYFAAQIINGWLAANSNTGYDPLKDRIGMDLLATRAYAMADAMLAARKVTPR